MVWALYVIVVGKYTRNEDCFQEHLFRHFHSGEHTGFLENVKIMLIDKTDGQNPKKREDHRRKTFKTYAPFRPNGQCLSMFYNFWTLYICVASSIVPTS